MNQKIKTDGVLFDLDGTLWDASVPVAAGFQQAIDGHPEVKEAMTPEIMRANMGRLLDEILHHTYPYLTEEQVQSVLKDYLALGCGYIAEAGGRLFDGLEATLKTLSARFPLFIVSNCQAGYIEAFSRRTACSAILRTMSTPAAPANRRRRTTACWWPATICSTRSMSGTPWATRMPPVRPVSPLFGQAMALGTYRRPSARQRFSRSRSWPGCWSPPDRRCLTAGVWTQMPGWGALCQPGLQRAAYKLQVRAAQQRQKINQLLGFKIPPADL